MIITELSSKEEMLPNLEVLQELYPSLTYEDYDSALDFMLEHNYGQIAVMENGNYLGVSGFWVGQKLWCGKYLEIDNIIVRQANRSSGVGELMVNYFKEKAKELDCAMIALDSYTSNFKAHKFFYNQGFSPKGFHFINILDATKIR